MSNRVGDVIESLSISCDEDDKRQRSTRELGRINEVEVNIKESLVSKDETLSSTRSFQQIDNGVAEWVSSDASYVRDRFGEHHPVDNRAEEIIQEARNAVPCSRGHVGYLDERTEKIIQDALRDKVNRNARLRTTTEVLQLAGRVLTDRNSLDDNLNVREPEPPQQSQEEEQLYLTPSVSENGASFEEFEKLVANLSSKVSSSPNMNRERILNRIDGIDHPISDGKNTDETQESYNPFNIFGYIWGDHNERGQDVGVLPDRSVLESFSEQDQLLLPRHSNFSDGISKIPLSRQTEDIAASETDPRMPSWIKSQSSKAEAEAKGNLVESQGGIYYLGTSRTVIIHKIMRGNWTWCTAWSPDGTSLALATENHHLAVVDTASSTVWRVKYDRRMTPPLRKNTTHSIRSIAWGSQFIAVGGTGNTVSVLAPSEPYPVVHMIQNTGFVGSLHWKPDSAVLAIGSRGDKCLIVSIATKEDNGDGPPGRGRRIDSTVLHTITREDWVNVVKFSPGGTLLAIGDRTGMLSLYIYKNEYDAPSKLSLVSRFNLEDSILAVEWSPDGKWLYAGGEDYSVTVIDTASWETRGQIKGDRWVQFIASSHKGSHIGVGGVASEVTILDAQADWKPVMKVELKGLVPLSAEWHPKDQYLAVTGQDNSVLAIETTDARHIKGYFLRSISAIISVEFAPDGVMVAIGNKAGLITFYKLSEPTFVTIYEMVLPEGGSSSICWSPDGSFVLVGNGKSLVVVCRSTEQNLSGVPPMTSGFSVRKVIRGMSIIHSLSIDRESKYVAVGGGTSQILDSTANFNCIKEWNHGVILANSWSPDGSCLAMIGKSQNLTIYDTSSDVVGQWRIIFTLKIEDAGLTLAWADMSLDGLQYLAYGGEGQKVSVIEIRTHEETWETVLEVPRNGVIHDMDWNRDGILSIAVGDGTVTILDLGYLRSGWAVNEMDYNWQRQGIVCSVELRRNQGKNSMSKVRWMPSTHPTDNFLAIGGTDGALEVVDLTERQSCKGFGESGAPG